jgi:hypothetical protein
VLLEVLAVAVATVDQPQAVPQHKVLQAEQLVTDLLVVLVKGLLNMVQVVAEEQVVLAETEQQPLVVPEDLEEQTPLLTLLDLHQITDNTYQEIIILQVAVAALWDPVVQGTQLVLAELVAEVAAEAEAVLALKLVL